jgi:hypothetical protein
VTRIAQSGRGFRAVAALVAALLALAFAPSAVLAQPAPSAEEVQQAQARWNEGKAAFQAGNFEAARLAFKQAYAVLPHPAFLQNIGEAELRTGRLVEAARHLSQYLRASGSTASQREAAKKSLQKAAARLGSVVVETNVDDAEVRVDNEVVGKSPLGSAVWYVEPGEHVVMIRKDGYAEATGRAYVLSGETKTIAVRVEVAAGGGAGAVAVSAAPAPVAQAAIAQSGAASAAGGEANGSLDPRTIVLLGGAALTLVGVGVGTAYAIKTGNDIDRYDSAFAQKNAVAGTKSSACAGPDDGSPRAVACRELRDSADQIDSDRTVRNVSFIAAAVIGAATVATFFLWRAPRDGKAAVALAPSVGPHQRGIEIVGRF